MVVVVLCASGTLRCTRFVDKSVQVGDNIVKINNSSLVEMGFQEVLSLLKNLNSDQLVLTVRILTHCEAQEI